MRTISPLSNSLQDEGLDADDHEAFLSENNAGVGGKSDGDGRESTQENTKSTTWGHDRVVRVPNETARWVFANQPQPEDTVSMQASGFFAVTSTASVLCFSSTLQLQIAESSRKLPRDSCCLCRNQVPTLTSFLRRNIQGVENPSVMYLKAVEMTISLKDMG